MSLIRLKNHELEIFETGNCNFAVENLNLKKKIL
jgi:hypothetical protein